MRHNRDFTKYTILLNKGCRVFKRTKEELQTAVSASKNIGQVITYLNGSISGASYGTIKKYIALYEIDTSHFDSYDRHKRQGASIRFHNDDVFVKNSTHRIDGTALKRRLFNMGVARECVLCGLTDTWNGKPITLQLDHINGDNKDNRLINLRILCPNCHSQTHTWGAKSRK